MKKFLLTLGTIIYLASQVQAADVFFSNDERAYNLISTGSPADVEALLASGYDVNKVYQCSTLLEKAIQTLMRPTDDNSDTDAILQKIEILIAAGADVNKIPCPQTGVSPFIWTMTLPLHAMEAKNKTNQMLDEKLLTKKSGLCSFASSLGKKCQELNANDIKKIYADLREAFKEYPQSVTVDSLKIADMLLSAGANINQKDVTGRTALHLAAMLPSEVNEKVIQYLIEHGANVNIRDIYGQSPLFFAFNVGNAQAVELLRKYGANTSFRNKNGAFYNTQNGIIINK